MAGTSTMLYAVPTPARRATSLGAHLGSLTQPGVRSEQFCVACGSVRTTRISLALTDGTPVIFTSCHTCEHRSWIESDTTSGAENDTTLPSIAPRHASRRLTLATVLAKTRRQVS
jgi:hypothetical protein